MYEGHTYACSHMCIPGSPNERQRVTPGDVIRYGSTSRYQLSEQPKMEVSLRPL